MHDPLARPDLDLTGAVEALARHRARWVMAGSVVLVAYGAHLEPGDLDVIPALDEPNLLAIADLLDELDSVPAHFPDWRECPQLEWHATWRPHPANVKNLDHLFITGLGRIDIVPSLCGTYEELSAGATTVGVAGVAVRVAHPSKVLERILGRRRKDVDRSREVKALREALRTGTLPEPSLSSLG